MKNIHFINTGGTITSKKNSNGNIETGKIKISKLVNLIPYNNKNLKFSYSEPFTIDSSQLTYNYLDLLHIQIEKLLLEKKYDAIIITHGTDTLEETATFLFLQRKYPIPIIITGSQYSFDNSQYDGISNLLIALKIVSLDKTPIGILIPFGDKIHTPMGLQKIDTEDRNAFFSINCFHKKNIHKLASKDFNYQNLVLEKTKSESSSTNLKTYSLNIIHSSLSLSINENTLLNFLPLIKNSDFLIIVGTGSGNINHSLEEYILKNMKSNSSIYLTSRVPLGRIEGKYSGFGGGAELIKKGFKINPFFRETQLEVIIQTLIRQNNSKQDIDKILTSFKI